MKPKLTRVGNRIFPLKISKREIVKRSITALIMFLKKLLDSDWPRVAQFKCNTSAKSVTPVQIAHHNSGLRLAERQ